MSVNYTDFDKIWASTSPLTPYEFSESQYKEGWNFVGNTPPSRQMWDKFMQQADEKMQYLYNHESVPVGHEYFTFNPNIPQGSLPLFGGEYSRETYSALWNWVQEQTGYLKTEAEWQQLYTTNAGNVPYYSDGDGSTTFRVPSLKCWVRGANGTVSEVGSYLQAGLPNITGHLLGYRANDSAGHNQFDGAFIASTDVRFAYAPQTATTGTYAFFRDSFSAQNSNSIYGNSATVQPSSIVGMWLVKAYGVVEDTGSIDEQQYIDDRMNAMKQYVDDELDDEVTRADGKYLSLSGGTMTGAIASTNTLLAKRDVSSSFIVLYGGTSNTDGAALLLNGKDKVYNANSFMLSANDGTNSKILQGYANGTLTWDGQPIQTSSDKRLKQDFSDVPAEVLEAWGKVEWKQFKYKADVERKGENCRFHTGLVAQDVKEVGEANNVDLLKYGILCHDVREATEDSEAVDLWTVRYEEALAMEVVYLRNEIKKLREEIKALRTE